MWLRLLSQEWDQMLQDPWRWSTLSGRARRCHCSPSRLGLEAKMWLVLGNRRGGLQLGLWLCSTKWIAMWPYRRHPFCGHSLNVPAFLFGPIPIRVSVGGTWTVRKKKAEQMFRGKRCFLYNSGLWGDLNDCSTDYLYFQVKCVG